VSLQTTTTLPQDFIISTDSSCLLNIQAYIDQHQIPIKTMHLADVLTHGWGNV
jgi:L-lactate dehydrogenase complex protein LldE